MCYLAVATGVLWRSAGARRGRPGGPRGVRPHRGVDSGGCRSVQERPRAQQRGRGRVAAGRSPGNQLGRWRCRRPPTFDGPLTRFAARGSTFVTPGTGFETSGAPSPEFADINPAYGALFAPFSPPRLFVALDTNVMDVLFNVPGNVAVPAGVTGFGAVFTDVDAATSTRLQFFAPDGALLFERAVPAATGNETQSFLGVFFDGERSSVACAS